MIAHSLLSMIKIKCETIYLKLENKTSELIDNSSFLGQQKRKSSARSHTNRTKNSRVPTETLNQQIAHQLF